MDRTIRNLDEEAYKRLKAHAALHDLTIGEAMNRAMRTYLAGHDQESGEGAESTMEGGADLSERVDAVLQGAGEQASPEA